MKLFAGSAHPKLVSEIARILGFPIAKSEVVRFGDSEVRVRINEKVKDEICTVIQPTSNPTDTRLMELFFFCDALKRGEAKKVIGILPYFGYSRQNREHRSGEAVSANVVIRFLETIGFDKIYTVDLHDEATEGVFGIPFKNLSALPLLSRAVRDQLKKGDTADISIVSPDQGGIERARIFGEHLFDSSDFSLAVIEKKRNMNIVHHSQSLNLYGEVSGKIAIIIDDIVTSGGTLINAANMCMEKGAREVLAAVAHHDFTEDAAEKLQKSPITRFFTTDTIPLKKEEAFGKLHEISIASRIAQELT